MKKLLLLSFVAPCFVFAQTATKAKAPQKVATAKTAQTAQVAELPQEQYLIMGTVTGYADGTSVSLLNGNTGAPEAVSQIQAGKFSLAGTASVPDFKLISIDNQAPYITLFLDNSKVTVTAAKDKLDQAVVSGSPSHKDFVDFTSGLGNVNQVFSGEIQPDEAMVKNGTTIINSFITAHPKSYILPLAVLRNFQLSGDEQQLDAQFKALSPLLQNTDIGAYVAKQVADNAKHPIGKMFANFSQADTSGKQVELASFRGKYVLVDFWASWCRPCRMENPNVVNAFNTYKDKNFTVLGVSLDQTKPAWVDAIAIDNLNWTQVSDLKGWGNEVAAKYGVGSIPQNFLIDPNGILVGKNLRGAALDRKLAQLIK